MTSVPHSRRIPGRTAASSSCEVVSTGGSSGLVSASPSSTTPPAISIDQTQLVLAQRLLAAAVS